MIKATELDCMPSYQWNKSTGNGTWELYTTDMWWVASNYSKQHTYKGSFTAHVFATQHRKLYVSPQHNMSGTLYDQTFIKSYTENYHQSRNQISMILAHACQLYVHQSISDKCYFQAIHALHQACIIPPFLSIRLQTE